MTSPHGSLRYLASVQNIFKNYFIYFWLCWVFLAALSLVVVSGGYSSLGCAGFSLWTLLLLQSASSRACRFPWLWLLDSRAKAQELGRMGLVALRLVQSSHLRDWTLVSCTGRKILYHWATREALFRTLWRVIPFQSSHRVPSQPNFPFCPTPFPILPQGNWSQHRSTRWVSSNSLFAYECRKRYRLCNLPRQSSDTPRAVHIQYQTRTFQGQQAMSKEKPTSFSSVNAR